MKPSIIITFDNLFLRYHSVYMLYILCVFCLVVTDSCKNRCISKSRDANAACHCDAACLNEGTCCRDYEEVCVEPSKWHFSFFCTFFNSLFLKALTHSRKSCFRSSLRGKKSKSLAYVTTFSCSFHIFIISHWLINC